VHGHFLFLLSILCKGQRRPWSSAWPVSTKQLRASASTANPATRRKHALSALLRCPLAIVDQDRDAAVGARVSHGEVGQAVTVEVACPQPPGPTGDVAE